jgi:CDP-2,3-bis-(O-geranylgeranyl)-sn-glycerol synthase
VGTAFVQSRIGWSAALVGQSDWPAIGLRLGIGAMAGDSAKSFAKRPLGIPPGAPWVAFDQLDFAAGALLVLAPRVPRSILDYGRIVAASVGGHIAVNHVAYGLGVRDARW